METAIPARPASIVADLLVPLGQALVTGGLLAGLLVFVSPRWSRAGPLTCSRCGRSRRLAITASAWLVLLGQTRRLLWAVERLTGRDLDGDGQAGEPQVIRVEVTNGKQEVYLDLPGKPQALATLARGVLNGRSFAEDTWSGRGGLFSRSEFRQLRDTLIERGLAVWRNPNAKAQGVELTAAGRAVFRRLAELSE